jgi:hypothetical protein
MFLLTDNQTVTPSSFESTLQDLTPVTVPERESEMATRWQRNDLPAVGPCCLNRSGHTVPRVIDVVEQDCTAFVKTT